MNDPKDMLAAIEKDMRKKSGPGYRLSKRASDIVDKALRARAEQARLKKAKKQAGKSVQNG